MVMSVFNYVALVFFSRLLFYLLYLIVVCIAVVCISLDSVESQTPSRYRTIERGGHSGKKKDLSVPRFARK